GHDPATEMSELMSKNRVLALGESHGDNNQMREFGAKIMPQLKEAGATHLALELPESAQPALNKFMETGILDRSILPPLLNSDDYIAMLNSAREAGLKLVAVDKDSKGSGQLRDAHMSRMIGEILDDPNAKVVFWAGATHLQNNGDQAVAMLKENYKVASVVPEYPYLNGTLARLTPDLTQPVAVPLGKAHDVARLPTTPNDYTETHYGNWDDVLIFPAQSNRTIPQAQ